MVVSGLRNGAQRLPVGRRGVLPVGADRLPAVAQALFVGVAVLRNDRGDPVRMLDRQPEPCRRAVVEHVDGIAVEADGLGEAVDRLRDPVECVRPIRHVGVAEARQIGRDDMESVGEQRDEVAEHMAGGREAVQQQQLRRAGRARLAVEDTAAVDLGGPIVDGGHLASPSVSNNHLAVARPATTAGRAAPAFPSCSSPRPMQFDFSAVARRTRQTLLEEPAAAAP